MELTEGTSTAQGVLLVDLSYSSLAHLFNGVTTGSGGYVYLISSDGEILYHPKMQLIDSGRFMENNLAAAEYKDGIDIGRELLRRSHVLIVCGDEVDESVKNDIAVAQRLGITATTLDGILKIHAQGENEVEG